MQRILSVAIVLLLLQIGLIAVTNTQRTSFAPYTPNVKLVTFSPKDVDSVVITDGKHQEITLNKKNKNWTIGGSHQLAAAENKVESVLAALAGAKRGLAVATTADAAPRFHVGKKDFAHHLLLKNGDSVLADIYLGTSAGYKQLYVRTAGNNDIVSIPMSSTEVSAKRSDWIDKSLFHLDATTIKIVKIPAASKKHQIVLHRGSDKKWFADTYTSMGVSSSEAATLVDKIATMNVFDLAEQKDTATKETATKETTTKGKKSKPIVFVLTLEDGSTLTYRLTAVDKKSYRVERSDNANAFLVSKWIVDEMTDSLAKIEHPQKAKKETKPEEATQTSVPLAAPPAVPSVSDK